MGKKFGNLAKMHGMITYTISPFQQKAFAGAIRDGIPNLFRRFREQVGYVVPPFIVGYLVYDYGEKKNIELSRKNPKDYENDV